MEIPFPNYFEFNSVNPDYQLNPNTKEYLTNSWNQLAGINTLLRKAPEGLLVSLGIFGIQDRMSEVRYLVVVPRELAEKLRQILVVKGISGGGKRVKYSRDMDRAESEPHPMQMCPPSNEGSQGKESIDDPFPELPCPWPWEQKKYPESEQPLTGILASPAVGKLSTASTRLIRIIYTYDYCGQYYGSAEHFCSFVAEIPGDNNYTDALNVLKATVSSNGDAPLIVLCPENITSFLSRLYIPNNLYDEGLPGQEEIYRFGLDKVLIHEMGHHMFPVIGSDFDIPNDHWPECMANWFTYHFLDKHERFILHIWTLRQPVEYQCYKALLGLSMRDDAHEFLSIIQANHRNSILVDAEYLCSHRKICDALHHMNREGRLILDPYLFYSLIPSRLVDSAFGLAIKTNDCVLITHSEALFLHLIEQYQYEMLFSDYKDMVGKGIIKARRASKGEYHKMLLEEAKEKPSSVGFCRSHS